MCAPLRLTLEQPQKWRAGIWNKDWCRQIIIQRNSKCIHAASELLPMLNSYSVVAPFKHVGCLRWPRGEVNNAYRVSHCQLASGSCEGSDKRQESLGWGSLLSAGDWDCCQVKTLCPLEGSLTRPWSVQTADLLTTTSSYCWYLQSLQQNLQSSVFKMILKGLPNLDVSTPSTQKWNPLTLNKKYKTSGKETESVSQ